MEKNKTKNLLVVLLLIQLFSFQSNAQVASPNSWVIYFSDKGNSNFSFATPADYLSSRAISRRQTHQIAVDSMDLPVHQAYIDSVVARGFQLLNKSKWLNAISVYSADSTLPATLSGLPFVNQVVNVKIKLNGQAPIEKWQEETSVTKNFIQPIHAPQNSFAYGPSLRQINMLQGDLLHQGGYRGEGMLIAVIDGGFWNVNANPAFDSLMQSGRLLSTWDFVSRNNNVFDDNNHGALVLSTMAANMPGMLVGTAPYAEYLLLRSEDVDTEYLIEEFNWVCAAEYADSAGADIINSSLGYTTFDNPAMNWIYDDMDGNTSIASKGAFQASQKGLLVVNSAGNSGASPWYYIGAPADAKDILAVGAVDSMEVITGFSSRGPSFDGRVKPDVAAMGRDVVLANNGGGIQTGNGTSFASPILAGMAACLWQSDPSLSNLQLRQAILESCDQYANPDFEKGYGIPDFSLAFTVLNGKNLQQPNETMLVSVGPNPTLSYTDINFFSKDTQTIEVKLFDLFGKLLQEKNLFYKGNSYNGIRLNIENLEAGIYVVKVIGKGVETTQKIVKQ
jgi:serine protease AprX